MREQLMDGDGDRDIKAEYVARHDCHIVIVKQADAIGNEWKTVTNLFCDNEWQAQRIADALTRFGHGQQ
jgi:hypothetical protein